MVEVSTTNRKITTVFMNKVLLVQCEEYSPVMSSRQFCFSVFDRCFLRRKQTFKLPNTKSSRQLKMPRSCRLRGIRDQPPGSYSLQLQTKTQLNRPSLIRGEDLPEIRCSPGSIRLTEVRMIR